MNELQITAVFAAVLELAQCLDVRDIKTLPGVWLCPVDECWTIAINGHNIPIEVTFENHMNVTLPAFEMSIWYNGWLAGLCSPFDGVIAAHEDGANEQTFIAAIQARVKREQTPDN